MTSKISFLFESFFHDTILFFQTLRSCLNSFKQEIHVNRFYVLEEINAKDREQLSFFLQMIAKLFQHDEYCLAQWQYVEVLSEENFLQLYFKKCMTYS